MNCRLSHGCTRVGRCVGVGSLVQLGALTNRSNLQSVCVAIRIRFNCRLNHLLLGENAARQSDVTRRRNERHLPFSTQSELASLWCCHVLTHSDSIPLSLSLLEPSEK